jgi:predicted nucleic acid-binding protein
MRIFLDANILFSAAKSDGAIRRLLELLSKAGHEFHVDGYVTEEARRNLAAKAPEGLATLEKLLSRMKVAAIQPMNAALPATMPLPEKDRPVLAAAIRIGCDALVTGDKMHFGAFYGKKLGAVTIYSPRLLAEALLK